MSIMTTSTADTTKMSLAKDDMGNRRESDSMRSIEMSRKRWPVVKFGDVVKNANLVERDLHAAGIERIVGLEHLDPENLHIRRWNSPENGNSEGPIWRQGHTASSRSGVVYGRHADDHRHCRSAD